MQCPISDCSFEVGNDVPDDCKATMLKLHLVEHQKQLNSPSTSIAKPEQLKRPSITVGSSTEDWNYFLSRWETYKCATKLFGSDISVHLLECCEEPLRKDLSRVFKTALRDKGESELLKSIKTLSVIEESTLVSRYNLHNMVQDIDEPIRNYVARIKGQANVCKLFVPCPNCNFLEVDYSEEIIRDVVTRGIADVDTRLCLLGEKNQDMSLEQTTSYLEAKESGKKSASRLINNTSSTTAAFSRYKKKKSQSFKTKCNYCGENANHGLTYKERQTKCSAFRHVCGICRITGHFDSMCRRGENSKVVRSKDSAVVKETNRTSESAMVYNELCESKCDVVFAASNAIAKDKPLTYNQSNFFSINHHVYNSIDRRWEMRPSEPQPTVLVSLCISNSSYDYFAIEPPHGKTATLNVIADTGCQSCLAGINVLSKLGLTTRHLLKCSMKMHSANNQSIPIMGALFLELRGLGPSGKKLTTKQIVYFTNQSEKFYINREACLKLGLVPNTFPTIGDSNIGKVVSSNSVSSFSALTSECNCPARQKTPPIPKKLPFPATARNKKS